MIKSLPFFLYWILNIKCCFIVHFVYYGPIVNFYYDRMLNFPHPYMFHHDQPINWIDGKKVNRTLTNVELSDIKRMDVLYKYGGLYIDNDLLLNIECIKDILCSAKENRLYLLDWVQRDPQTWLKSVPIAFLFTPKPKNPILRQILTAYDPQIKDTIKFSGSEYVQKFKPELRFFVLPRDCQHHMELKSYQKNKTIQYNWLFQASSNLNSQNSDQRSKLNIHKKFYKLLWESESVVYPKDFNYQGLKQFNPSLNHVEIVDKENLIVEVRKYSQNLQKRRKLQNLLRQFKLQTLEIYQKRADIQQNNKTLDYTKQFFLIEDTKQKNLIINVVSIALFLTFTYMFITFSFTNIKNLSQQQHKTFLSQNSQRSITQKQQSNVAEQTVQSQQLQIRNKNQSLLKFLKSKKSTFFLFLAVLSYVMIIIGLYKVNCLMKTQIQPQQQAEINQNVQKIQIQKSIAEIYNQKVKTQFGIQWNELQEDPHIQINLRQIGLIQDVQIDSRFDYLRLNLRKQFYDLKRYFQDIIPYELFKFQYDNTLQKQKETITNSQFFNQQMMEKQLEGLHLWSGKDQLQENTKTYLASYLVYNKTSKRIKQLQYYYYNKKYNLDQIFNEIPICVISTGFKVYTKDKYKRFFESIEDQNYTNYHVVVVDDNSPDGSAGQFYEYLRSTNFSIKNKVKIVKNNVNIGALGSMYVYVKKFCNQGDIVVNIDTDDFLIGRQAFKVLNAVYQDPNIWYVYTSYFLQLHPNFTPYLGPYSLPLTVNISDYRLARQWNTSHTRTYRQQVMARVPIEQFIQYYLDKDSNTLIPRFYTMCADRFQVYANLELCGDQRVKYISDPLYFYDQSGTIKNCHYEYSHYIQYKSRTKRIMKPLASLDADVQYYPDTPKFSNQIITQFKNLYKLYLNCKYLFQSKGNLN